MAEATLLDTIKNAFGSAFGVSRGYVSGHDGIDLSAKEGTPVLAVASGTVEYARNAAMDANCKAAWACGGGNVVNVNIGNSQATQYAHLLRSTVSQGQFVTKGQVIGYVGQTGNATGPHLHFGLWDKSKNVMVNPRSFLAGLPAGPMGPQGPNGPVSGDLVGAWGDMVKFPEGHLITSDDVKAMVQAMLDADARGLGCKAENRACFFAGTNPIAGAAGVVQVNAVLVRHIGEPWGKPLQETLQREFRVAANEASDIGGLTAAIGGIGETAVSIATYLIAIILIIVGLYIYGKSASSTNVPA